MHASIPADPSTLPQWLLIWDHMGPGSVLMAFLLVFVWRLQPSVKDLIRARQLQVEAHTEAAPIVTSAVVRIAEVLETLVVDERRAAHWASKRSHGLRDPVADPDHGPEAGGSGSTTH